MGKRYLASIFVLAAVLMINGFAQDSAMAGQSADAASPAASAEKSPRTEFAIIPVGDHPQGYFEDIELRPGESIELAVMVFNAGTAPVTLDAFVSNALSMVNGGFYAAPPTDAPTGATQWIEFPAQTLELHPGEEREIPFRVTVPTDTQSGQYMAAFVAQTPEALNIPGATSLDLRLASGISISILVPGERTPYFELGVPEVYSDSGLLAIHVPISNTGNYLVRPSGELALTLPDGELVLNAPIEMGSVYTGVATLIEVPLPEQLPPGDYELKLALTDPESGVTDSIEGATVIVPEPVDPTGVHVSSAVIEPNDEQIVFASVDVVLENGGQQIPTSNVVLEVIHNGVLVEEFPLATNQMLLSGENTFNARYLPADMWQSGEYTFRIKVSAVDPNGGQETVLLDEELDATIEVP